MGQRGIDIGIDDVDQVHSHNADDAYLLVTAIIVLLVFERFLEPVDVEVALFHRGREKVHVALGAGVAVHQVAVALGVVVEHAVVPRGGIGEAHKGAHHDGQLPVAVVVDLAQAGAQGREPHGTHGVGVEHLDAAQAVVVERVGFQGQAQRVGSCEAHGVAMLVEHSAAQVVVGHGSAGRVGHVELPHLGAVGLVAVGVAHRQLQLRGWHVLGLSRNGSKQQGKAQHDGRPCQAGEICSHTLPHNRCKMQWATLL